MEDHSSIDISEITHNIYIGDKASSAQLQMLTDLGITMIVVAGEELEPFFPKHFKYLHVKVKDSAR